MVIPYRRVRTTYRTLVKMGPVGCPETSVRNYHCSLCNSAEEHRSHLLRGRKPEFLHNHFSQHKNLQRRAERCTSVPVFSAQSAPTVHRTKSPVFITTHYCRPNQTAVTWLSVERIKCVDPGPSGTPLRITVPSSFPKALPLPEGQAGNVNNCPTRCDYVQFII